LCFDDATARPYLVRHRHFEDIEGVCVFVLGSVWEQGICAFRWVSVWEQGVCVLSGEGQRAPYYLRLDDVASWCGMLVNDLPWDPFLICCSKLKRLTSLNCGMLINTVCLFLLVGAANSCS